MHSRLACCSLRGPAHNRRLQPTVASGLRPPAPAAEPQRWASRNRRAMKQPSAPGRLVCLALSALLYGCTDGATRIAYDIEAGVGKFQRSDARTYEIRHIPESMPDGCAGAYTVQFSANSSLVIWCKESVGGKVTSSHTTTYHLRFVKIPRRLTSTRRRENPQSSSLRRRMGPWWSQGFGNGAHHKIGVASDAQPCHAADSHRRASPAGSCR
jgi:hypothetical protein